MRYHDCQLGQSPEHYGYNGPAVGDTFFMTPGGGSVQITDPGSSPSNVQMIPAGQAPSYSSYGYGGYAYGGCPDGYIADGYGGCYPYAQQYGYAQPQCPACPVCPSTALNNPRIMPRIRPFIRR